MKKQYDLKKLNLVRRGAVAKPTTKVQKTIRLDLEIVAWLVQEAARRGIPYQTLINSILRETMRHADAAKDDELHRIIRAVVRQELKKAA